MMKINKSEKRYSFTSTGQGQHQSQSRGIAILLVMAWCFRNGGQAVVVTREGRLVGGREKFWFENFLIITICYPFVFLYLRIYVSIFSEDHSWVRVRPCPHLIHRHLHIKFSTTKMNNYQEEYHDLLVGNRSMDLHNSDKSQ